MVFKSLNLHKHHGTVIHANVSSALKRILDKTVTFSLSSTNYEDTEATETFTFKELGIDEDLDEEGLKIEIDRIFQAWVWDKLNISYSIVINKDKRR